MESGDLDRAISISSSCYLRDRPYNLTMALDGLCDQPLEQSIMSNQNAVLVQPPLQLLQQLAALRATR
jgi:hypothetical protein